jgi:copper chaperone NosL
MRIPLASAALALLALVGCDEQKTAAAPPPPHELSADAVGHYCGMNVLEHPGPKGQIILASRAEPVWFSSARDAFAFTLLPEEAKDIRAIYVSDMARAPSWEAPGADNWVEARSAYFVIGSDMRGGMGAAETAPFSERVAAERFAERHGGRVVNFADMPADYVLGAAGEGEAAGGGGDRRN